MAVVGLIGTLDTKGDEYQYLAGVLSAAGVESRLIDVGVLGTARVRADVSREEIAKAAGKSLDEVRNQEDRGSAISLMAQGGIKVVSALVADGQLDGVLGLGGTGGTTLVSEIMRALPVGFPKLIVSTVASGDTRPYVGTKDITMMYSIVDIAGINEISSMILTNAAAALGGMVTAKKPAIHEPKPVIGATMFGLTTPAVDTARKRLESYGYEVLVFHATGVGGASMESLIDSGLIAGVLDVTTTEMADELVGGVFPAGPSRLTAAGRIGIPQVVSLGALDMVNFGAKETVPSQFADRTFYIHNASVTLMRTSAEECAELGRRIAQRIDSSKNPEEVTVFIPTGGFSGIDVEGQPFHDPEADQALIQALQEELSDAITVVTRDAPINDPSFAEEMAEKLHLAIQNHTKERGKNDGTK